MKTTFLRLLTILLITGTSSFLIPSCKGKPNDAEIQTSITEKVSSDAGMSGVTASVSEGVVTLSGQCKDETCRNSCAETVKGIKGVKSVVNNISVTPAAAPVTITADDPLKQSVDAALSNYKGVTADVNDGVVTLRGDIKRADLQKLMITLNGLNPKKIENQLTVK